MVVVMNRDHVEGSEAEGQEPSPRGFVTVPMCGVCYNDPENRTRTVKGSFFVRSDAAAAKGLAGTNSVVTNVIPKG